MKNLTTATATTSRRALGTLCMLGILFVPAAAQADETQAAETRPAEAHPAEIRSPWSINFTPALVAPHGSYHLGGGVDPELKYSVDLGGARLSAGVRVGGYYAKNLFGITAMPTLRLALPIGPVEPYASFGMGYGWIPELEHDDLAQMARIGVVFHVSKSIGLGVESTFQKIENSDYSFPSFGSMVSFDL